MFYVWYIVSSLQSTSFPQISLLPSGMYALPAAITNVREKVTILIQGVKTGSAMLSVGETGCKSREWYWVMWTDGFTWLTGTYCGTFWVKIHQRIRNGHLHNFWLISNVYFITKFSEAVPQLTNSSFSANRDTISLLGVCDQRNPISRISIERQKHL